VLAINADDTLLLGSVAYGAKPLQPNDPASKAQFGQAQYAALGPDGKPLSFAKAKGVRMMERFETPVPAELFTIDLKTGARTAIYKTEEWIGHAQFSPTDPKLIRFCKEGPWQRVTRVWLINADGSNLRSVHERTQNMEIWGHEFFSDDGKWLWFDLQTPRGQVFWVAGVEIATGRRVWKRVEQNAWGVHFNVAPDGVYVTNSYDSVFLLALAIEKSGQTGRDGIATALREVANAPGETILPGEWKKAKELIAAGTDINYQGASGEIEFDAKGDVAGAIENFAIEGGKIVNKGLIP